MPPDAFAPAACWHAHLALAFERRGPRSVLASRRHEGPLVVQKALYPEGEGVCHAIVVHPPAGVAGGDELAVEIAAAERSHALLTTPGAGKWYRSAGRWAAQRIAIDAGADSTIEWLPQENILYEGARARMGFHARLAAGARLVACEVACLGRSACGESFESGHFAFDMRIERGDRVLWIERGRIEPGSRVRESAAGLAGADVFGTLVFAVPEISDEALEIARRLSPREGDGAVTRLPGLLVARYRGRSAEAARDHLRGLWAQLREPLLGRPAMLPRIWST